MSEKIVQVTPKGRVAVVRFDRGRDPNPMSLQTLRELTDTARGLEEEQEITAVVLTGRETVFTAGVDLKDPAFAGLMQAPLSEKLRVAELGRRMCDAWEAVPQITVAAIEGLCLGGGVALTVACDFRVVAQSARLAVPELKLAMNMSWGSLPRLTRLVGPARAKRIVLLAEMIEAERALDWGLADEIAEEGHALEKAGEIAARLAEMPPLPVRMTKASINAYSGALDRLAAHMDHDQFSLTTMSRDHLEGVTAFLEKRKPDFKGE